MVHFAVHSLKISFFFLIVKLSSEVELNMTRFFILSTLCLGLLSGCGVLNNRDIHTQIISNPPGASI